jgi:hypothetical protein
MHDDAYDHILVAFNIWDVTTHTHQIYSSFLHIFRISKCNKKPQQTRNGCHTTGAKPPTISLAWMIIWFAKSREVKGNMISVEQRFRRSWTL